MNLKTFNFLLAFILTNASFLPFPTILHLLPLLWCNSTISGLGLPYQAPPFLSCQLSSSTLLRFPRLDSRFRDTYIFYTIGGILHLLEAISSWVDLKLYLKLNYSFSLPSVSNWIAFHWMRVIKYVNRRPDTNKLSSVSLLYAQM
jgi:hypothetical protein